MSPFEAGLPGTSDALRQAFRRRLLSLADAKRILGIRYSDWLLGAPSIETGIAAASMAQDEWGHARLLYATLKDFGDDPTVIEHDRATEAYASAEALDAPLADWAEVTAAMALVDGAFSVALEGLMEGGYESIEGRLGKMLGEEEFHASLAEAWFRRIANGSDEGRDRMRAAAEAMVPSTLRFLAPDDDAHRALVEAGLCLSTPELLSRYVDRVGALLELVGVKAEPAPLGDDWDAVRGRGAGHPGEEAVERARGDQNRALFVE